MDRYQKYRTDRKLRVNISLSSQAVKQLDDWAREAGLTGGRSAVIERLALGGAAVVSGESDITLTRNAPVNGEDQARTKGNEAKHSGLVIADGSRVQLSLL